MRKNMQESAAHLTTLFSMVGLFAITSLCQAQDKIELKEPVPLKNATPLNLVTGPGSYKLSLETKDGTLSVLIHGDADVRFKNGELQIYDAEGKLKYALAPSEKNQGLPPDKHLVKVVGADGLKLDSPEFVMENKGKVSVRVVALLEKPPALVEPKAKPEFLYALPWLDEQQGIEAHLFQTDIAADGKLFFACGDTGPTGYIRVCDTATGKEVQVLVPGGDAWFTCAKFLPGNKLLAASYSQLKDLYLYDVASGKVVRQFAGHEEPGPGFAVSPDGKRILSWSDDKTVRLWDVETGKEIRKLEGHGDKAAGVFSPDGKQILTFSPDKTLRLWSVDTGKELRRMEGHADTPTGRFSPDGKQALSFGSDGTICLWDLATGNKIHKFEGQDNVQSAYFVADGQLVVAVPTFGSSAGKKFLIWETKSGKLLREIDLTQFGAEGGTFTATPDGRQGLVCDGQSIHVLDLVTCKETHRFDNCPMARAFSFSPDGTTVVAGSFRAGAFGFKLATPSADGGWSLGAK